MATPLLLTLARQQETLRSHNDVTGEAAGLQGQIERCLIAQGGPNEIAGAGADRTDRG